MIDSFWTAIRYTPSSASWSTPVTLSPDGRRLSNPDLAMDGGGNATVIFGFESPTQAGNNGIHATHYTAASGTWAGVDLVRDGWSHTSPRITVDASGNLTAAWHVTNDFSPVKIWAARRPARGAWEASVIVRRKWNHWESASLALTLPVDQAGNVTLVWEHFDSPGAGSSLESTQWLANGTGVQPTGPPGAPVNVSATVSGNTVNLAWGAPTGGGVPTSYSLVGRQTAGGPVLATVPMGAGTSFSVTAPNGTFVLSVRAANASGAGPESTSVTVRVPQAALPPGPPSNLAASVSGTTVSFTWSPASSGGAVGNYVLVAGQTPGFSAPVATVPLGATPGYVAPGVPAGTYYVRVVAQNAGGTSAPSNETIVTVGGCAAPAAPGALSAVVSGANVMLTWDAVSAASAGYAVEAGTAPGRTDFGPFPAASTGLAATAPSGTYYVRVRARSACGSGPASNEVIVRVP